MARRKTKDEKEREVLLGNVRELMKTRMGRDVVWDILSQCHIYGDSFTGNSQTFYLEGQRSVGLYILQLFEDADPTIYARLLLDKQNVEDYEDGNDDTSNGTYTDTDNGTDD